MGGYELKVVVTDNAGNQKDAQQKVYKDIQLPVVEYITFAANKEENSKWEDMLNLLTFGIFFNDDVTVTVDGYDPGASAGIREYNLFVDGNLYEVSDDGQFVITYDQYRAALTSAETGSGKLSFNIVDNVDNACIQVSPTKDISNAENPVLMLEKDVPSANIYIPRSSTEETAYYYDEANDRHWYSSDIDLTIEALDNGAGIRNITATLNGQEVCNEDY